MGNPRKDDFFPEEVVFLRVEELPPFSLRVLLGEMLHKGQCAAFNAVGFGDGGYVGVVLSGGCFEANIAAAMRVDRPFFTAKGKPLVGVGNLHGVESIFVELMEELGVRAHQPNDDPSA